MQVLQAILWCSFFVGCGAARTSSSPAPTAPAPKTEPAVEVSPRAAEPAPSEADIQALMLERQKLVAAGQLDQADDLCAGWIARANALARAEGYKCSANVLVRRADDSGEGIMISSDAQRLAVGGLATRPRYSGNAIVKAIDQLDQAASLLPKDLSIHQGRMYLALASGNYARAISSLELSLKQHPEARASDWLEYTASFPRAQAKSAVAYLQLLAASRAEDDAVLTELGAWLEVMGQHEDAKAALEKALQANEKNAMAHWRLGEVLMSSGDRTGAEMQYRRSLALRGEWAEERRSAYKRFKRAKGKQ